MPSRLFPLRCYPTLTGIFFLAHRGLLQLVYSSLTHASFFMQLPCAYWQREEVINSRPDIIDSQVHARNLRYNAETRTQKI